MGLARCYKTTVFNIILYLQFLYWILKIYTPCLKKRPTFVLLELWRMHMNGFSFFGKNATDTVGNQKML